MKTWKNIAIIIGLTLVVGYLVWTIAIMPDKQQEQVCSQVIIEVKDSTDRHFVTPKEIEQLIRQRNLYPLHKTFTEINIQELEDAIAEQPYLKNVECHLSHAGVMHIVAEQRLPRFRVLGDENYYVDDEGRIMPIGITTAYYVPIFTGRVSRRMAQEEILAFVDFLEDNPAWNAQIRQVHINEKQEVEIVPTVGGHIVLLGKWDGFEQKLKKLERFYEELNYIGWKDWRELDLRYKGQVIARY